MKTIMTPSEWQKLTLDTENKSVTDALKHVYAAHTIHERFDALIILAEGCFTYLDKYPNNQYAKELQAHALAFASAIVDAKNFSELKEKVGKRRKYKGIDPKYMPWPVPPTKLDISKFENQESYVKALSEHNQKLVRQKKLIVVNEDDLKKDEELEATYLTEKQREDYRIFINDGKLERITKDDQGNLILEEFNTATYSANKKNNLAMFVVSADGDIYAGNFESEKLNQSSFLADDPFFYAGEFTVLDGILVEITNLLTEIEMTGNNRRRSTLQQNLQFLAFINENKLFSSSESQKENRRNNVVQRHMRKLDDYEARSKTLFQLINYYAKPFFEQFNKDADGVNYINYKNNLMRKVKKILSRKDLEIELPALVKLAYYETIIDKQIFEFFEHRKVNGKIANNYISFARILAKEYIDIKQFDDMQQFITHINDVSAKIIEDIQSVFESIYEHTVFIYNQALVCQGTDDDIKSSINEFAGMVFEQAIKKASQSTDVNLDDGIFDAKIYMAVSLHVRARKNADIFQDENIIPHLYRHVKLYVDRFVSSNNKKDESYIVEVIEKAVVYFSNHSDKLNIEQLDILYANAVAKPFIDKFKDQVDKVKFKELVEEQISKNGSFDHIHKILKQAYCKIRIEAASQNLFNETKPVQQSQFIRLAHATVANMLNNDNLSVEQIDARLKLVEDTMLAIDQHREEIEKFTHKSGIENYESQAFAIEFVNQMADNIIRDIINTDTPANLADIIFETKTNVLIEFYAQQLSMKHSDEVIDMFRNRAKFYVNRNEEARTDHEFIIPEILNARNYLIIEIPLFDALMKEIDKLRLMTNSEDFIFDNETVGTIESIYDEITKMEKITSLDDMQVRYKKLVDEVKTAQEFYGELNVRFISAKFELSEIINKGEKHFARGKATELLQQLKVCQDLPAIIDLAKNLLESNIIQDRGLMNSLFANPVKQQVMKFVQNFQTKLVSKNYLTKA